MDQTTGTVLANWAAWMRAASQSEDTISLRISHITHALESVGCSHDPWAVTTAQLAAFIASKGKPNTKRSYRGSLRAFYGWAVDLGLTEVSPARGLPPVKVPRALPRPLPDAQYREAVASASNRALRIGVQLGGQCGLRRGEIARVRREHLLQRHDGYWLHVVGKGDRERWVPIPSALAAEILACPAGWLFPSDRRPGQHITAAVVGKWIAGHLQGHWTTHNLRHRCGTNSLRETRDIRATQELLGHAKIDTTVLYTLVEDDRIRAAMDAAA